MFIIDSIYTFPFNQGVNLQKRKYKKLLNTCELYIYCMKKYIFLGNKNKNEKRGVPETPVRSRFASTKNTPFLPLREKLCPYRIRTKIHKNRNVTNYKNTVMLDLNIALKKSIKIIKTSFHNCSYQLMGNFTVNFRQNV